MFLGQIHNILAKEGIYSRVVLPQDQTDPSHIEVELDEDHAGRNQIMIIKSHSQLLNDDEQSKFVKIEFTVEYPFSYAPIVSGDLARFIAFINRFSDLPGFELDEIDQKVLFRHVHFGGAESINSQLFTSVIGLILMYMDINASNIESIANGERSFDSLVSEILTELNYL